MRGMRCRMGTRGMKGILSRRACGRACRAQLLDVIAALSQHSRLCKLLLPALPEVLPSFADRMLSAC